MIQYKQIFVGSNCNNNCIYCKYEGQVREGRGLEQIKAELQEQSSSEMKSRYCDSVELVGGDPAIRDDLIEIVSYAVNWGWRRIKIRTNGRSFSDWNFTRMMVEAGARIFEVKVNGHKPALHEAITRVTDSFWETINGIRNIRSINILDNKPFTAFIGIRTPICKENYDVLEEIVRLLVPLGIDRITLSFDDYNLSMTESIPFIINTIETSIFNKIWIMVEKIPLCLLKGYEHHVSEIYLQIDDNRSQHDNCRRCIYRNICKGVVNDYLAVHGFEEFKAVCESQYAADIGVLKNAQE